MKILESTLKEALASKTLTLCWCWLITRLDGVQLGFTNLDVPITIGGVTYYGTTGFDPGAAQQSQGVDKLDSQTLKGILDQTGISKAELDSGIFEGAQVRRFLVDYTNLPDNLDLDPPKHLELPVGYLGSKKRNSLGYEIQTKDHLSLLENNIGTTTSKTCRANLGDDNCRVDLSSYTHSVTVTAILDRRIFTIDGGLPNKYFDRGRLRFTSGVNQGLDFDISYYQDNQIILAQPAPFDLSVGDTLTAIAGCAKTKLACIQFGNFANFMGEPDVPTTDLAINTPSK